MRTNRKRMSIRNPRVADLRSVRIPSALASLADERAKALGCTFTDMVVQSLSIYLGGKPNPRVALLAAVAQHVAQEYRPGPYPTDVTRHVFFHIRDTPELRALYDDAIVSGEEDLKGVVNQCIGRVVAYALTAHPGERFRCGPGELIESYALLAPLPFWCATLSQPPAGGLSAAAALLRNVL